MRERINEVLLKEGVFKLIKKQFLKKNYNSLYLEILSFKDFHYRDVNLPLSQIIFLALNNLEKLPKCECGNYTSFKSFSEGYREYCSAKCSANSKRKQNKVTETCIKKYNTNNVSKLKKIKDKKKETYLKNYNKEHIWSQKEGEVRSCEKTCNEKYGVSNVFKSKDFQGKIKITFQNKYGTKYPIQNKEVYQKAINTLYKNHGVVNPMMNKEIHQKSINTLVENYGVEYPMVNKEIHQKAINTLIKSYGVKYPTQNKEVYKKAIDTLYKNYGVTNARYLRKYSKSSNIENKIRELLNGKKIIVEGKEYDICLEKDIFEIDGDYFHPLKIDNLSFIQLNSILNDFQKRKIIENSKEFNLYKVLVSDLVNLEDKEISVSKLKSICYQPDYTLLYDTIILSKGYIENYLQTKGKDKLLKYIPLLHKFVSKVGDTQLSAEEFYLKTMYIFEKKLNFTIENLYPELKDIFEVIKKIKKENVDYRTVIVKKEILLSLRKSDLNFLVNYFYKFLITIQPTFPFEQPNIRLDDIIQKINSYKYKDIVDNNFYNNISSEGVLYLKQCFSNFYSCSNKNTLSPVECWKGEKQMKNVIRYRIGLNKNRETFNFSLHQMVRGLSAYRKMVSFFKPIVAAQIYKYFLKDKKIPTVIDPCAGFGGRLLGFKSLYPEGKYIGIEPNKETYSNLVKLSKGFTNVELHNCKLEDYKGSKRCDLTFTSIPYYDLEDYKNSFSYVSLEQWKDTFVFSLTTFENLIVNLPVELQQKININYKEIFYLINNSSHFNKVNNLKIEHILKCF
jgi:hypothetical protein